MRTYGINSSTNKNQNTINEWSNMYKVELVCNSNIYEYSEDIDMNLLILLLFTLPSFFKSELFSKDNDLFDMKL